MKKYVLPFLLVWSLLVPALSVRAEDVGAIKARMSQRVSAIDEMKTRGVVGENNRGLLETREGNGSADAGVIEAENKDREAVYAYLAQQTGSSADQVGRARARQIAQASVAGVWIQDASGTWKKK